MRLKPKWRLDKVIEFFFLIKKRSVAAARGGGEGGGRRLYVHHFMKNSGQRGVAASSISARREFIWRLSASRPGGGVH